MIRTGLVLLVATGGADAATFESLYHTIDSFKSPPDGAFATADIDGDGADDLVFPGNTYDTSAVFVVGKRSDGSMAFKQAIALPAGNYARRTLVTMTSAGTTVIAVSEQGLVRTFSGWPLSVQRTFNVGSNVSSAAVGDVDANGVANLVVSSQYQLRTYSLETGMLVRSLPVPSGYSALAVAQLDADPALEIVAGGYSPAIIVDGATQAIEWSQSGGLPLVVAGALGPSATSRIVSLTGSNSFGVYQAFPWSLQWSGTTIHAITALAIGRLQSGSSPDVVLAGEGQFGGSVYIIDATTQLLRRKIVNPNNTLGVGALGSADLDADGVAEVAFSTGWGSQGAVTIADSQTSQIRWNSVAPIGALDRTVIGDVNGDGRLDLVAATSVTQSSTGGTLAISDFDTGVEQWRSPSAASNPSSPFSLNTARVLLAPKLNGVGMHIVLAGASNNSGRITVVDGLTNNALFEVGGSQLYSRRIADVALFDYNHDGVMDFVAGTVATSTATQGAQLQIFSGVNGASLWISVRMGRDFEPVNNVLVLDRTGPAPELVAVLPDSLRAYDAGSGLLRWTLLIANNGATVIPDTGNGEELAIFRSDGNIAIHSAATRAFLRSFVLPAPIGGLGALPGNPQRLLAWQGDRVILIDATNGSIVASTEPLGSAADPTTPLAAYQLNDFVWNIATGTRTTLYRKRLILEDRIFTGSFDG